MDKTQTYLVYILLSPDFNKMTYRSFDSWGRTKSVFYLNIPATPKATSFITRINFHVVGLYINLYTTNRSTTSSNYNDDPTIGW